MRVFYLTTEFPWPPLHGGRVRSLSQLRLLVAQPEVHRLRLFSLSEVGVSNEELSAMAQALGHPPALQLVPPVDHPVHLRQHRGKLAEVALRRVLSGTPYLLGKWRSRSIEQALAAQLQPERPDEPWDVVYIDHLGMAVHLPLVRRLCPTARVVLECHNVESEFFEQFATRQRQPLRLLAQREAQAAAEHEARILAEVDATIAISERDAEELRKLVWRRQGRAIQPLVVAPTVTTHPVELPSNPPPRIVYVGNLTWHPNVAGLDWLCQKVWPLVRRKIPQATLTIAGSGLSTSTHGQLAIPPAWHGPGIQVIGFVPDLREFVTGAAAMAAPVFGGSGVRIKLLDSLRLGVPTVTTRDGASGLPLVDHREVLISDDPAGFAERLALLCEDTALRLRLREAGLAFLHEHHSQTRAESGLRMALGLPIVAG